MSYNYESHTWGSEINKESFDFPRMKFDLLNEQMLIKKPLSVLEIGCGVGKFIFTLAHDFPKTKFVGSDISFSAIKEAQTINKNPNISFFQCDAQNLCIEPKTFDGIIILDLLEHIEDPEKVISDAVSFLKPGGVLHVFIPCEAHSVYFLVEKIIGFHPKEKTAGHIQRFSRNTAKKLIEKYLKIKTVNYSFHLIGSIMDCLLFTALLNKKLSRLFWNTNKFYNSNKKSGTLSKIMNGLLGTGSFIAYWESKLLQNSSFLATGIHITAVKSDSNSGEIVYE